MSKINIVLFGCRKITVDIIDHVIQNYGGESPIVGVIAHDEERDRVYGKKLVAEHCNELKIPCFRFDNKIDKKTIEDLKPDLIFSSYYRKILKQEVLDIPKMGCINIHPAMLPFGRGPAPSLWNVLNGDSFAGSTIHYMIEAVDAGDIINQKQISIDGMTGFQLNERLMTVGLELFKENFENILQGTNQRIPQNHSEAIYTIQFRQSLRHIYWEMPDRVINQIRAFAKPFDGAIASTINGESIIVWAAAKLDCRTSFKAPGFFEVTKDGILVQTCADTILITEWENKNAGLAQKGRFVTTPILLDDLYAGEVK